MKWIKTNGSKIETNDLPATIKHCESLGWKEDQPEGKVMDSPKESSFKKTIKLKKKADKE